MSDQISNETENVEDRENTIRNPINADISIKQLKPYSKNPFTIPKGNVFDEMIASIKEEGVLQEILARYTNEKDESGNLIYEIISGHTRVEAAKKAGLDTVPAKIMDMDDNEAAVKVVESNYRRSNSTPCELGKAFKLRLDALNRQGKRSAVTSVQNEQKSSRDEVAGMFGISASKVQRLVRLAYLIPAFEERVDNKNITLSIAENISYLSKSEQSILDKILNKDKIELTRQQSAALKNIKMKKDETSPYKLISEKQIIEILTAETTNKSTSQSKPVNQKTMFESISKHKYFQGKELSNDEILNLVLKALDNYEE